MANLTYWYWQDVVWCDATHTAQGVRLHVETDEEAITASITHRCDGCGAEVH